MYQTLKKFFNFKSVEIAPSTPTIPLPWSKIPDDYNWVALDSDGEWNAYSDKPTLGDGSWRNYGSSWPMNIDLTPVLDDSWKHSLTQRPEGEPFAPSDLPIDESVVASKLSELAKLNAEAFNRKLYGSPELTSTFIGSPELNSAFIQETITRIRDIKDNEYVELANTYSQEDIERIKAILNKGISELAKQIKASQSWTSQNVRPSVTSKREIEYPLTPIPDNQLQGYNPLWIQSDYTPLNSCEPSSSSDNSCSSYD